METLELFWERGWRLVVVINDFELFVIEYIEVLEWEGLFMFIKGFDFGYGVKLGFGMVIVVVDDCDVLDGLYLMVGDLVYDILVGKVVGAIIVVIGSYLVVL